VQDRSKANRFGLNLARSKRKRNGLVQTGSKQSEQTYSKLCQIKAKLSKFGLYKHSSKDIRSTNVPQTFRHITGMKPKCLSFHSRICPIERDHIYLVQKNRFWTKSKQSVFNRTNSGTIPKRFGFVAKTISERLSFCFWHYYSYALHKHSYGLHKHS
jgi:hypothetical protein